MTSRLASFAGTLSTLTAGALVAWVGISALGPIPTLILFATVAALASVTQRMISR